MPETYCKCCGGEFNQDLTISGMNPYYGSVPNPLFDGKICAWCAYNVEYFIVCICLDNFPGKSWTSDDGKTWWKRNICDWPEIAARRAYLKASRFKMLADDSPTAHNPCPRCKGELIKKESESIFGEKYSVKKCNNCGYCD
jgi:hypothetical protein